VIATKSSIRLAPSPQPESLIKDNAPIAIAVSAVQTRAYELYELRGRVGWPRRTGLVPSRNWFESQEQTSV